MTLAGDVDPYSHFGVEAGGAACAGGPKPKPRTNAQTPDAGAPSNFATPASAILQAYIVKRANGNASDPP
jgi:hypothetical protein